MEYTSTFAAPMRRELRGKRREELNYGWRILLRTEDEKLVSTKNPFGSGCVVFVDRARCFAAGALGEKWSCLLRGSGHSRGGTTDPIILTATTIRTAAATTTHYRNFLLKCRCKAIYFRMNLLFCCYFAFFEHVSQVEWTSQ